jgi:hypothetical protein
MFERFTKLLSKKNEDQMQEDQMQIGSPQDLRKGDSNSTTQHDALPRFQPEGLISREAAQAKLSKEDQTRVLPPWQRPAPTAPDIRFDFGAPISLQDAKSEFATVAEAQAILKDATQHRDQNGLLPADKDQPTVTEPAAIKSGNDVKQTSVEPVKPTPQWVSAKPNFQSTANQILEQNKAESTPRLDPNPNPNRELGRTHSSIKL